jgi:hypothetical protein
MRFVFPQSFRGKQSCPKEFHVIPSNNLSEKDLPLLSAKVALNLYLKLLVTDRKEKNQEESDAIYQDD